MKKQEKLPSKAGQLQQPLNQSSNTTLQPQSSSNPLAFQSNSSSSGLLVTQNQTNSLKANCQLTTPNSQQVSSSKNVPVQQSKETQASSQTQVQLSNVVIGEHQKNILKQTLKKNAHKPQTKALLDKIMNRASSVGRPSPNNNAGSNSNSTGATQNGFNKNEQSMQLQINGVGPSSIHSGKKVNDIKVILVDQNSHLGSVMNSTVSSQQSNAFLQIQVASSNQANAGAATVKGKVTLKKRNNLEQTATANSGSNIQSQQTSYRSSTNIHNKGLSRSSSVQKLRDTMYRFTMYQPKGDNDSQKEPIHIIGESKPFQKDSKIVKVKGSTITQLQSNAQQQLQQQALRPSIPNGSSNSLNKKQYKVRVPLADKVKQQNEKLKQAQVSPNKKNQKNSIDNGKAKNASNQEDDYEVDLDHVEDSLDNNNTSGIRDNDSARSTQDFFFSKQNNITNAQNRVQIGNVTDTTMTTTLSYNNTMNQKHVPLPPKNSAPKQAKSTNFLFTFSNAEQEIIKNSGALNNTYKRDGGISSNNRSQNMMTPKSMSYMGATTGTNTANSVLKHKKRSIFSENPSQSRPNERSVDNIQHSESNAFAISNIKQNLETNINILLNPKIDRDGTQDFKHHYGSSDGVNILDPMPSSPSVPQNMKFKSALNKFMEMHISSPSFKSGNNSNMELLAASTTSNNKNSKATNPNIVLNQNSIISNQSAMKEYCEQTISGDNPAKSSYSQLMMQTFSKIPPQMYIIQKGTLSPRNSYPIGEDDQYYDNDSVGSGFKSPGLNQILMLGKQNSNNTPTGSAAPYYQSYHGNTQQQLLPNISRTQQSHTLLPSIRPQANSEMHTPMSQQSTNSQKRAFSVNFSLNKYQINNVLSPQQQNMQSSSQGRPTSSLISKKAGLPQVFLEKYKKNGSGALINSHGAGEMSGSLPNGNGGKIFGHHINQELNSPFTNAQDAASLSLQKRHLQSAECILIPRQAFSEGAASRAESQSGLFGGSFARPGLPNMQSLQNIENAVFSPPGGIRSPGVMNKVLSSMAHNIPHLSGLGRFVQNTRTLQFEDAENLYNSQQLNSGELRFFKQQIDAGTSSLGTNTIDEQNRYTMENGNSVNQIVHLGQVTPIQKQMPPKPPSKRIQTSTQEARPLRKPVISKKFFGKIFPNCSPEPRQNTATASLEEEPEMKGTSVFSMHPSHLQQPLRYDPRINAESIISNGVGHLQEQGFLHNGILSKQQQYLVESPLKDAMTVQGVEECSEFEREESANSTHRRQNRKLGLQQMFDQQRDDEDTHNNNNNYDDNYDNEEEQYQEDEQSERHQQ